MAEKTVINIAKDYARQIKKKYDIINVYLFGSYANGNFNDDSDIDIAVVLKDYPHRNNMQLELMRIRRDIDSRIEPHPFRDSEFNEYNILANEVLKNGILIS